MRLGEIQIDSVHDATGYFEPEWAYPSTPSSAWGPHLDQLTPDGRIELEMGAFLIRTRRRIVLIDAGLGPFQRATMVGGALLDSLAALGVRPQEVDTVVFTHLHFDHIGWASVGGEAVFPNATYRCAAADWHHFVGTDRFATSALQPIEDHFEVWDHDITVAPGLDMVTTPGHTPGSSIAVLSSGGERAMLIGDIAHCPVELLESEWEGMSDVDPLLARQVRDALAIELEGSRTLLAGAHFPGLQLGRLWSSDGQRRWAAIEKTTNRIGAS